MGKTQLGLKFALHAAERGYRVLFYTLEMMSEEVGERVLMMREPALYNKVRSGYVSEAEVDGLCRRADETKGYKLMVDDTPYVSIDDCVQGEDGEVALGTGLAGGGLPAAGGHDGTGRKEPGAGGGGVFAQTEGPGTLAGMSGHRASQLNRQVEQTFDQRPELKHLRESGAIEQDADLVIMLHRNMRGGDAKRCGLIVAKNRHGEMSQPHTQIDVELF